MRVHYALIGPLATDFVESVLFKTTTRCKRMRQLPTQQAAGESIMSSLQEEFGFAPHMRRDDEICTDVGTPGPFCIFAFGALQHAPIRGAGFARRQIREGQTNTR